MKRKKLVLLLAAMTLIMSTMTGCDSKSENNTPSSSVVESTEATDETKETEVETETTEATEATEETEATDETKEAEVETEATEATEATEVDKEATVAKQLLDAFCLEIQSNTDIEAVVNKLLEEDCISQISTATMNVEPGYMAGFDEEITMFNKGVAFGPVIGTIPFVGYVFETDTPDELVATLNEKANLNWNICTSADEMLVTTVDNYVFVVMAPYSFDN